jgi:type II secretory pathway pseudopilin PulG
MKAEISHRSPADGAFTILEMLVAMAVFLLMALMVVGLIDGTMRITSQSQRRISADAGTRQALDRMTADFSHAIVRADLPFRIEKNDGNDGITFFAQAEGYTAGRGISMIGYRVMSNSLQRGVEAIGWTGNALGFTTLSNAAANTDYLRIDDTNYETVATDVFRLEFAFLMGDGAISNAVGTSVVSVASSPRASTTNTIRAVIVGVAALDARARNTLTKDLVFSDAPSGRTTSSNDILTGWDAPLTDTTLPQPVRESLRIYQRTLLLNN